MPPRTGVKEQTRIAEIERRLREQFPAISIEVLDAAVREHHSRFQASPIRDFIPLLVEKRVRQELADASPSRPVAWRAAESRRPRDKPLWAAALTSAIVSWHGL